MIEVKHLEVLLMDNGEIICLGKTIGWKKDLGKYLHDPEQPDIEEDTQKGDCECGACENHL